jgi:hypothetical protein
VCVPAERLSLAPFSIADGIASSAQYALRWMTTALNA